MGLISRHISNKNLHIKTANTFSHYTNRGYPTSQANLNSNLQTSPSRILPNRFTIPRRTYAEVLTNVIIS